MLPCVRRPVTGDHRTLDGRVQRGGGGCRRQQLQANKDRAIDGRRSNVNVPDTGVCLYGFTSQQVTTV